MTKSTTPKKLSTQIKQRQQKNINQYAEAATPQQQPACQVTYESNQMEKNHLQPVKP
jgi:hypothetical protein